MSEHTTHEALAQLTAKAEALAATNIVSYKRKLFLYALLGYAAIFGVLLLLFALVGGLGAMAFFSSALLLLIIKKKLIFVLLPTIWVLFKALWVKFDAPTGYVLKPADYPELFAKIDQIRAKLEAPKVHEVILTNELNAAVVQTPRFGMFGGHRNTIILGLELLLVLSPQQAEAVLAHEFGHLSGNHGRFNGWIYRVRISWQRIMQAFHRSEGMGANLMRRFFDWYAPRFSAYSFALARINEYEADAVSAELTNKRTAGHALVNVHVAGPYVDENYWQAFFQKADTLPAPDHLPWQGLSHFMGQHSPAKAQLEQRLEESLTLQTNYDDTHPSLRDRLAALGASEALPGVTDVTAAEAWLGDKYQNVIHDFDSDWLAGNADPWKNRYEYVTASQQRLTDLRVQDAETMDDNSLWERANLEEEFGSKDKAMAAYHAYQARYPDSPAAAFCLGRYAFDQEDDAVLVHMKKAMAAPNLVIEACQYAYHYLLKTDRATEAEWWKEQANRQIERDEEAEWERQQLTVDDAILAYEASDEVRVHIVDTLKATGKVKKAWLAQKKVKHYPEQPALAIAITAKGFSDDAVVAQVSEQLNLDCTFYVVPRSGDFKKLAKKIIAIDDALM
ncbi:MAG: M48 family metallopeptidase [Pseudomonadales bacterium]